MENTYFQTLRSKILSHKKLFLILLLIVVVAGGGIYYTQTRTASKHILGTPDPKPGSDVNVNPLTQETTPYPLNKRQKIQLSSQTSKSSKEKTFDILAGNFYFSPNKITVNQGDEVIINIISQYGVHDLISDSLHVRTTLLQQGQIDIIRFKANKKGTYEFYCDLPRHKEMGMKGTIVIK